ncbi:GspH/FimT family pseudopilin [Variovorax sp. J22R133]|uniref:GspH/FimT family pseudopilin n=1 Tax=Variovorax brevis TaxID=3053503 RepID=UPI002577B4CC|nr:GspH/FimT family pseudopilin [Variovorax sp. J22R133]MDM0115275.1 GspH/FimT family pseudopilin [Variovorax sp. J22R133]
MNRLQSRQCRRGQFQRGFTLVELMVTITLFALLSVFAYPSYTNYIQSAQVRASAESVMSGLELARAEAIRGNRNVQFSMLNTSRGVAVTGGGGTDWSVMTALVATPTTFDQNVQTRLESSSTSNARAGTATAVSATVASPGAGMPANILYTGMGRLGTATAVRKIDFTGAAGSRTLSIVLSPGGDVRLCDPALSMATNPQGCA